MNTYSDNQTGHLYVLGNASTSWTPSNDVVIGNTVDHKFNIQVKHNNVIDETTDQLDDRYIMSVTCKAVTPVYFRKWTVGALAAAPVADTMYSLYFYLENMQGFGMQDRWDIAATYKAQTSDTIAIVMANLAIDLYAKINVNGPIKNDFIVSYGGTDITDTAYTAFVESGTLPTATSGNNIVVRENPNSPTYTHTDHEILMGSHPYEYDLTLSTYDGTNIWGTNNKRRITGDDVISTDALYVKPRFTSGVVVKDMENFFMRNRKDLYSLTPNFNTSIVNEGNADRSKYYSMVNVHYAFSDNLGFSYFSEKDLNIAVVENSEGATTNGETLKALIEGKTLTGIVNSPTIGNSALNTRVTTLENA